MNVAPKKPDSGEDRDARVRAAADLCFMEQALDLARQGREAGEVPVGALVVSRGEIVGAGYNAPISTVDPTAHAEIVALRAAARTIGNYRLSGATLYCTMEPCVMCLGAMLHARIGRLVFGASDPKVGAVGKLGLLQQGGAALNHGFEVTRGVKSDVAAALLEDFFRQRRSSGRPEPLMNGEVPKWS